MLLYERFNYTVGDTLSGVPAGTTGKVPANQLEGASNAWNGTTAPASVPANQLITDNNLSYSGLAASTGKSYDLGRTIQSNVSRITVPGGPYGIDVGRQDDLLFVFDGPDNLGDNDRRNRVKHNSSAGRFYRRLYRQLGSAA